MSRTLLALSLAVTLPAASVHADEGATLVWFMPGDRLIAEVGPGGGLTGSLMTTLAKGQQLVLDFLPVDESGVEVSALLTEAGEDVLPPPVAFAFEATHATAEPFRKTFTLPVGGPFFLGLEYAAPPGTYVIQTSAGVPKKFEGSKSKKLKPAGAALVATHTIPALAGSTLDLRLDGKKGFDGPLAWTLRDELGAVVASGSAEGGVAGVPDVDLEDLPLVSGGTYRLEVAGFAKKKERVKMKRTLHPGALLGQDVPICPES